MRLLRLADVAECPCGEPTEQAHYDRPRACLDVKQGRSEAPLVLVCAAGHVQELWIDADNAKQAIHKLWLHMTRGDPNEEADALKAQGGEA